MALFPFYFHFLKLYSLSKRQATISTVLSCHPASHLSQLRCNHSLSSRSLPWRPDALESRTLACHFATHLMEYIPPTSLLVNARSNSSF
uniref:Uncharacterized protein n=1 Tax=Picea glauca TaxID=3330 RepID=A0A117NFP6_PICGL|nr:hypothetical protein ABT39_MTgene2423 [Picea glauca]QHR86777.1 hypothetical protein Q903MT_gene781 [Picea sitchensis]